MKRLMDIVISCIMLISLSPIYLIIAILVWLNLGTPVLSKQRYPGMNEKLFTLYRFKTMAHSHDHSHQFLLPNERLTKLGRFLTTYHLDHLPELYNVLLGDMSLVGPRPVLIRSTTSNELEMKRHDVRPGLMGWSQLHHQQILTWDQKYAFDLLYIEHQTCWFDIKIMFKSLMLLFSDKRKN